MCISQFSPPNTPCLIIDCLPEATLLSVPANNRPPQFKEKEKKKKVELAKLQNYKLSQPVTQREAHVLLTVIVLHKKKHTIPLEKNHSK